MSKETFLFVRSHEDPNKGTAFFQDGTRLPCRIHWPEEGFTLSPETKLSVKIEFGVKDAE